MFLSGLGLCQPAGGPGCAGQSCGQPSYADLLPSYASWCGLVCREGASCSDFHESSAPIRGVAEAMGGRSVQLPDEQGQL